MYYTSGPIHTDVKSYRLFYMTRYNRGLWLLVLVWLLLGGLVTGHSTLHAAEINRQQMLSQPEKIPKWVSNKQIRFTQIPNPHWNTNDCKVCHKKIPAGSNLHLRGKSIDALCEYCHSVEFDHSYIHPSAVSLSRGMSKVLPKDFTNNLDKKNKLTCVTCHDIQAQCLSERRNERLSNPQFFRGGPYKGRSDICYKCHDVSGYQRRNAHDQIDDNGKLKEYTCRLCHDKTEGLVDAASINEVGFNVKDNLIWVCSGCHPLKPHPSGNFTFTKKGTPNHLIVPPEGIKNKMLQSEKERGVILPLDPITGRVFCGTCHNPHEKGVIKNQAAAKGADENKRLRTEKICSNCHDK